MKQLTGFSVLAFTVIFLSFYACTSQPADKTSPDDMVEGTDGGLDSARTTADSTGTE